MTRINMKKFIKKWLGIDEDIRKSVIANLTYGRPGIRLDRIEILQDEIIEAIESIKENECENSGHNWVVNLKI